MTLKTNTRLRKKFSISGEQLNLAKSYIQGAVYCWVKNREDEIFALRDLVGGENYYWQGTPLYCLYEYHIGQGKKSEEAVAKAVAEAGKECGWLLKSVLDADKRTFDTEDKGLSKGYKWIRDKT